MLTINQITIVYPESEELDALASALARKMKRYRIPGNVVRLTGISSLSDVKEPWLIVLCTPDTPKDPGIQDILQDYTGKGLYGHILTLLVSGLPQDSFPEILLHEQLPDGTIVDHEPLAANIVADSPWAQHRKLNVEKLRLLAPILGVTFDDLMNRKRRQRMQIATALGAVVLAAGIGFLIILVDRIRVFSAQEAELKVQYERIDASRRQVSSYADDMYRSYASAVAAGARVVLDEGDCELAMLLCCQFLPELANMEELTCVLQDALTLRGGKGYVPVTAAEALAEQKPEADALAEQEPPAEALAEQKPEAADAQAARNEATELPENLPVAYGRVWCKDCSSEGYYLYQMGESEVCVYDPASDMVIGSFTSYTYPSDPNSICFAGEADPVSGRHSADKILCDGILFEARDQETPVPESIEEQAALAQEYLNGRTLTDEERDYYGMEVSAAVKPE